MNPQCFQLLHLKYSHLRNLSLPFPAFIIIFCIFIPSLQHYSFIFQNFLIQLNQMLNPLHHQIIKSNLNLKFIFYCQIFKRFHSFLVLLCKTYFTTIIVQSHRLSYHHCMICSTSEQLVKVVQRNELVNLLKMYCLSRQNTIFEFFSFRPYLLFISNVDSF